MHVVRIAIYLVTATLLLLQAGCASYPKVAYDKNRNATVHKIAVLEIQNPTEYGVVNFGNPVGMFGAIGGAVAAADGNSKGAQLARAMQEEHLELGSDLTKSLVDSLNAAGYLATRQPVDRSKIDPRAPDYTFVRTNADAILDVGIRISGYMSRHAWSDYEPFVWVSVKLIDTKTQESLYSELFAYGHEPVGGTWAHIPDPRRKQFANFEALMQAPAQVADGLRQGPPLIAKRIVGDLR